MQNLDAFFSLCTLNWRHSLSVPLHHPNTAVCLNIFFFPVTSWHGLYVVMETMCWFDLLEKDSGNNLWLWWSLRLWDDGIFILAAMNYWGVESAASRTGGCMCVYVCIHVWWDLLVDSLMLRLYLHRPHTHLILASSTVFSVYCQTPDLISLYTAHTVFLQHPLCFPLVTWSRLFFTV